VDETEIEIDGYTDDDPRFEELAVLEGDDVCVPDEQHLEARARRVLARERRSTARRLGPVRATTASPGAWRPLRRRLAARRGLRRQRAARRRAGQRTSVAGDPPEGPGSRAASKAPPSSGIRSSSRASSALGREHVDLRPPVTGFGADDVHGQQLLAVADVARLLGVCTKTVRRLEQRGQLVTFRIGGIVRVDPRSVARLLAISRNEVANELSMNSHKPGVNAGRYTHKVATVEAVAAPGSKNERRAWRVYKEGNGYVVKYYDAEGKRRTHRIAEEAGVLVRNDEEAERYAADWFAENVKRAGPSLAPVERLGTIASQKLSFEQFGRMWTSGELARRYPDHVKVKRTADADEGRLRMYVYPAVGSLMMSDFEGPDGVTLVEKVIAAMTKQNPDLSAASRRQILQAISRLFNLAVYPAKLLVANPLPKGFMPKADAPKAKSYVYPNEDEKLLACKKVKLERRLFYGILAREGMRVSELLDLTWGDVDLEHGIIRLDENKTDEPRAWALDPGVVEALRRWKKHFAHLRTSRRHVLGGDKGAIGKFGAAEGLRRALKRAGVTRPALFQQNDVRLRLRAHDLRATFVTVNLALGKTEAWITDRTGHKSSAMIYRYKRQARMHDELKLGALRPLHEALPEFARVKA
jgi:integrase